MIIKIGKLCSNSASVSIFNKELFWKLNSWNSNKFTWFIRDMLEPLIIFTGYFVAYLKSWWELSSAYRLIFVIVVYSYFEKGCRKKCARDNPER